MAKLPKSIIKKYGISKKAWAVFRGSKKKSKGKKSVKYMARKKKSSGKQSNGLFSKALQILSGAAVAALYEVFVSPFIPLSRTIKNVVEMIIGVIVASMKRLPLAIRAGGAALATINAFELIVPLVSGIGSKNK